LLVDPDAVLPAPLAFEGLQPASRRRAQEVQRLRGVELRQLARRDLARREEEA
jgi:hypothetical protein